MNARHNHDQDKPGLGRRRLLQWGGGALGWLAAQRLLARDVAAQPAATPAVAAPAKALVVLWMNGGPSHVDTFDPKRGADAGPFRSIATRSAGLRISEHLPRLAARSHRYAVIRSMTSKEGNHQRARYLGHTGYAPNPTVQYPSLGAWVSHERGGGGALPAFVSIGGPGQGGGFLGVDHAPFVLRQPGGLPQDVAFGFGVDAARFDRRGKALDFLEARFARRTGGGAVAARRTVYRRAARLMTAPEVRAFDISDEPQATQDAYGDSDFGRGCLVARRLLEAGTAVVEVALDGWDTHRDNFARVKERSALLDAGMAALLDDLAARDRLRDTLVLCMGEFGRSPRLNANEGRDHHPRAFSALLAGGGLRGGLVLGATDDRGEEVVARPVRVADVFATLAQQLGIAPDKVMMSPGGRPVAVTERGKLIGELVA